MPGRKPARASSALVPVATASMPSAAIECSQYVDELGFAVVATVSGVRHVAVAPSSWVAGVTCRTPSPARRPRLLELPGGQRGDTAVAATTRVGAERADRGRERNAESAPPENATTSGPGSSRSGSPRARAAVEHVLVEPGGQARRGMQPRRRQRRAGPRRWSGRSSRRRRRGRPCAAGDVARVVPDVHLAPTRGAPRLAVPNGPPTTMSAPARRGQDRRTADSTLALTTATRPRRARTAAKASAAPGSNVMPGTPMVG